jgi:methionyl aminopeptidase
MILKKTKEEIEILREGGRHLAQVLEYLKGSVTPGVSTFELEEMAVKCIKELGDSPAFLNYKPEGARRRFPAALCVSINSEIVHGIPNEHPKILQEGDIVSLDLGLTHEGLITDSAITVGVGNISKEDTLLLQKTKEALMRGIEAARGGAKVGDIGFAIEEIARKNNFNIAEGLSGHGVGYEVHEDPYVPNSGRRGEGEELVPGMVIAIEPMFVRGSGKITLDKDGYTFRTKDGSNAAHFEHTIAITDGGPIILTEK